MLVERSEAFATPAEQRVIDAIRSFESIPSIREIGEAAGMSPAQAHAHVCGLEAKRLLTRGPKGASRTIKLTGEKR